MGVQAVDFYDEFGVPIEANVLFRGVSTLFAAATRVVSGVDTMHGVANFIGNAQHVVGPFVTMHGVATLIPNTSGTFHINVMMSGQSYLFAYNSALSQVAMVITGRSVMTLFNHGSFSFTGGGELQTGSCFEDGNASTTLLLSVEVWMTQNAFNTPALEQVRQVTLSAVSKSTNLITQIRTMLTTVYMTELGGMFNDLLTVSDAVKNTALCQRRRLIEAEALCRVLSPRYDAAFRELGQKGVPEPYLQVLRQHLTSGQHKNRLAAHCAIVLLAALLQSRS